MGSAMNGLYKPTPEGFIVESMFPVMTKSGQLAPFKFNWAQRELDRNWATRNLIPKARQLGVSTFVLARWTAACLMHENINAVVVSHESNATQRLLQKVHFFLDNLRGPKPEVKKARNRIEFKKTGSTFFIGTAGSDNFGRGDTIHRLHCSEYAFWENGPSLLKGMLASIPVVGSEVAIESTGKGYNDYAQRCFRARDQVGAVGATYACHFLNWLQDPTYAIQLSRAEEEAFMGSLDPELEEDKLVELLTPAQLAFRRNKIIEEYDGDLTMFKQEYPITLDECFQASGNTVFWHVRYLQTTRWEKQGRGLHILRGHPDPNKTYILGVDVSGGVGGDNSVIQGFCLEDEEQVLEWVNNKLSPDALAYRVREYGQMLNNAYVVCENNNHGIVTLADLQKIYPVERIHFGKHGRAKDEMPTLMQAGERTTVQSKPLMVGRFRKAVASTMLIHSPDLRAEMETFVEDENGKMGAQDGYHDDRVMACCVMMMGWNQAAMFQSWSMPSVEQTQDPFSFERLFDDTGRGDGFPIASQVRLH